MSFQKDGPKRRRRTRRELPHGQVRRWGSTVGNFKREREAKLYPWNPAARAYAVASRTGRAGQVIRGTKREGDSEREERS